MSRKLYLDSNATALLDPRIKEALKQALEEPMANPSSPHRYGQTAKAFLSEARHQVASYLGVNPSQIIFTSGGSEGAFLCINGLIKTGPGCHIISSSIEHACVFNALETLRSKGTSVTYLPVDATGTIKLEDLSSAITPSTQGIVLMAANNETGVKLDLTAVAEIAKEHKIPLIVDGVSSLGKELLKIPSGVSAMFFSGHKIHALQGVGFIYLDKKIKLNRAGTENMMGILSLSLAVKILAAEGAESISHMQTMRDALENALLKLPHVKVNGIGPRVCNTSNLMFGKMDGEQLLIALDQAGIAVSLGSACSSGSIEPSRVLLNMGLSYKEAKNSLRFSLSRLNTMEEIEEVIRAISKIYV